MRYVLQETPIFMYCTLKMSLSVLANGKD